MESHSRAWGRAAVLLAWTLGVYALWLLSRVLVLASRAAAERAHHALMTAWARGAVRFLRVTIHVRGEPPAPPYFLVSNHLSYLDVPILYTCLRGSFLAKSDVASWPVLGTMARTMGTLFVDRSKKSDLTRVIGEVERRLARGGAVVVFPEGTSTRGERVLPFKPSLFEVAVRTGSPVSYASISYRTPEGAPSADEVVCWWGSMPFLPHVYRVLTLPSFEATLTFGPEPIVAADRKTLAHRAHTAVERSFTPVVSCRAS